MTYYTTCLYRFCCDYLSTWWFKHFRRFGTDLNLQKLALRTNAFKYLPEVISSAIENIMGACTHFPILTCFTKLVVVWVALLKSNSISVTNYPSSRFLRETWIVGQLVKKFSVFYGIRWFITVVTRARHWSLSWAWWICFTPSHSISLRSVWYYCHLLLGLPSDLLPSVFPAKTLYALLISSICAAFPVHFIFLD
jgi:hypothetical protein